MLHLRPATRDDVPLILSLIRELATYERDPDAVVATEEALLRDGFGERPLFRVTLAEWRGHRCGERVFFVQDHPTIFRSRATVAMSRTSLGSAYC